ncbi:hypothetical protein N9496_06855 [Akkermansiaceae bacterium]|nr:hypothetical protein [Akkermansiaceae bacterium]
MYDLIVIGGGPAGYVGAIRAATPLSPHESLSGHLTQKANS